jgi:hypothetical protein
MRASTCCCRAPPSFRAAPPSWGCAVRRGRRGGSHSGAQVALEVPELVEKFRLGMVSGFDLSAFNLFHPSYTQDALLMTLGEVKYRYLSDPFEVCWGAVAACRPHRCCAVQIFAVDFTKQTEMTGRHDLSADCRIRYHGTLHAIAIWFRMDLGA